MGNAGFSEAWRAVVLPGRISDFQEVSNGLGPRHTGYGPGQHRHLADRETPASALARSARY
jgi:hypothetical protein